MQGVKESLHSYIDRYMQVTIEVEGGEEALQCWIFENGLLRDHPLCTKLGGNKVKTTQEMLRLAQPYMNMEGKLNTHFDNPTSTTDTNFDHPPRKESCR